MSQSDIKILNDQTTPEGVRIVYFQPSGEVCSQQIGIAVKDGVILGAEFSGGCSGNTQGLAKLVTGMKIEDVINRLSGIRCGWKSTSCPDQFARALSQLL